MKRIPGLAMSIVVIVSLTHNGFGSSSTYAAPQAATGKSAIEQLFVAWNSHDPDKVVASFTEDVVYEDVAAGHTSRGRAEVRGSGTPSAGHCSRPSTARRTPVARSWRASAGCSTALESAGFLRPKAETVVSSVKRDGTVQ